MRKAIMLTTAMTLLSITTVWAAWEVQQSGANLGAVTGGDIKKAHEVIEKKCITCHTSERIEAAWAAGKNMLQIQQAMEKKGAKLNSNEHEVLGIYWKQTPLKKK
jgi:uncharacterized membrane protein